MIRFLAKRGSTPIIGIGLSHENLRRLKNGEPIRYDIAVNGAPVEVWILAGATEQDIVDQLLGAGMIDDRTVATAIPPDEDT